MAKVIHEKTHILLIALANLNITETNISNQVNSMNYVSWKFHKSVKLKRDSRFRKSWMSSTNIIARFYQNDSYICFIGKHNISENNVSQKPGAWVCKCHYTYFYFCNCIDIISDIIISSQLFKIIFMRKNSCLISGT